VATDSLHTGHILLFSGSWPLHLKNSGIYPPLLISGYSHVALANKTLTTWYNLRLENTGTLEPAPPCPSAIMQTSLV
jgi:hypothetical protein